MVKKKITVDISGNQLVPKHIKLSEKEAKKVLESLKISVKELPRIILSDPAIEKMDPKPGDVIKIVRESKIVGENYYYRGVVNE